jgi:CRISPR-associated endonuclease/helicase Cas3
MLYAHSLNGGPCGEWERLIGHLRSTSQRAAAFAMAFGWSEAVWVTVLLHEFGKISAAFQAYIAQERNDASTRGPDRSTAGSREASRVYGSNLGGILAELIAGHHAGLDDAARLEQGLSPHHHIEPYESWLNQPGELPLPAKLQPVSLGTRTTNTHAFPPLS